MNLLRLAFYALFLLGTPLVQSQTLSISGSGAYTNFYYQNASSSWSSAASTAINFGLDLPASVERCYGCDPGTYRYSSYAPVSSMGLNPALDSFFNNQLSAISPSLNTSLISSSAPANLVSVAAARWNYGPSTGDFATGAAAYSIIHGDARTIVLSDGEFDYSVTWASTVRVVGTSCSGPGAQDCALAPFDENDVASWFSNNRVVMDDWVSVAKVPIGAELFAGSAYIIEATGYGNVAVVPEPEMYVMMLAGLGMLGWVMRRRLVSEQERVV